MANTDDIPVGPPARRLLEARVGDAIARGVSLAFVHVDGLDANEVVHRLIDIAPVTRLGAVDEYAVLLDGVEPEAVLLALDVPTARLALGVAPAAPGMTTGQVLAVADRALREARRRAVEMEERAVAAAELAVTVRETRFRRSSIVPRPSRPLS